MKTSPTCYPVASNVTGLIASHLVSYHPDNVRGRTFLLFSILHAGVRIVGIAPGNVHYTPAQSCRVETNALQILINVFKMFWRHLSHIHELYYKKRVQKILNFKDILGNFLFGKTLRIWRIVWDLGHVLDTLPTYPSNKALWPRKS